MFCMHCKAQYEYGDAFCESCGRPIAAPKQKPCANCGYHMSDADKFCESCGMRADGAARQPAFIPPIQTTNQARMLIVFLLEASASAAPYYGQLLVQLRKLISDVKTDGLAQSAVDMTFIQFNYSFDVLKDLHNITNPNQQHLALGNVFFDAPIREALRIADSFAISNSGAYKPWVIMISSSEPSDDISSVALDIQYKHRTEKLRFMALSVDGRGSASLKRLTDVVFKQNGPDFASFFEWIRKSIKSIVRSRPGEKPQLPQLEGNVYRDR